MVNLVRLARRIPAVFPGAWTEQFRRDKAVTWARVPARVLAARARAILAVDARTYLRECPRPVLYLAGSRDSIVPRRNAEQVVRESPSAKIVMIDGPHFAMYTNPEAAACAIAAFMRDGASDREDR